MNIINSIIWQLLNHKTSKRNCCITQINSYLVFFIFPFYYKTACTYCKLTLIVAVEHKPSEQTSSLGFKLLHVTGSSNMLKDFHSFFSATCLIHLAEGQEEPNIFMYRPILSFVFHKDFRQEIVKRIASRRTYLYRDPVWSTETKSCESNETIALSKMEREPEGSLGQAVKVTAWEYVIYCTTPCREPKWNLHLLAQYVYNFKYCVL